MNDEIWAEFATLSRRMARIEIALTERIIALEAEVMVLKGEAQLDREVYPDAREIKWRDPEAANLAIQRIMEPHSNWERVPDVIEEDGQRLGAIYEEAE